MDISEKKEDPFATLLTQSESADFNYTNNNEAIPGVHESSTDASDAEETGSSDQFSSEPLTPVQKTVNTEEQCARSRVYPVSLAGESPRSDICEFEYDCCAICNAGNVGSVPIRLVHGVTMCHACRCFYDSKRSRGVSIDCINHTNSCNITSTSRGCSACRYRKADRLVKEAGGIQVQPRQPFRRSYYQDSESEDSSSQEEIIPEKRIRCSVSSTGSDGAVSDQVLSNRARCIADVISNNGIGEIGKQLCKICGEVGNKFIFNVNVCEACRVFYQSWVKNITKHTGKTLRPCIAGDDSCESYNRPLKSCSCCRFGKYYRLAIDAAGHKPFSWKTVARSPQKPKSPCTSLLPTIRRTPNITPDTVQDLKCEVCNVTKDVQMKKYPQIACCKACTGWFRDRACRNNYALAQEFLCSGTAGKVCSISRDGVDYKHHMLCSRCRFLKCLKLGLRSAEDPDLEILLLVSSNYTLAEIDSTKCCVCEEAPVRSADGSLCIACETFAQRSKKDGFVKARSYVCRSDKANATRVLCSLLPSMMKHKFDRCNKCRFNKCIGEGKLERNDVSWFGEKPVIEPAVEKHVQVKQKISNTVVEYCEVCSEGLANTVSRGRRVCWACQKFATQLPFNDFKKAATFVCRQAGSRVEPCTLKNSRENNLGHHACNYCRVQRVIELDMLDANELKLLKHRSRAVSTGMDAQDVKASAAKCPICLEKDATDNKYGQAMCVACSSFLRRSAENDFEKGQLYVCINPKNMGKDVVCDLRPKSLQSCSPCKRCRLNKMISLGFVTFTITRTNSDASTASLMRIDTDNSIKSVGKTSPDIPGSGSSLQEVSKLTHNDVKMLYEVYRIYFSDANPTRHELMIISSEFKLKYRWVSYLFRQFKVNK